MIDTTRITIKQLHEWRTGGIYQEYVKMLLLQNPLIEKEIRERRYYGEPKKPRWITRKVYQRGYWTRFKRSKEVANFYVYTEKMIRGKNQVVEIINYDRFMAVIDAYFDKARECIINGESLNMGNRIGYIQGMHVERNHANKQIDWGATKKGPWLDRPDGTRYQKKIYFTDDSWVRIGWVKLRSLANETFYEFQPSSTERADGQGFKDVFQLAHRTNPNLKLQYPFYPYIQTQNTA